MDNHQQENIKTSKKKKAKGPIRLEAIVPFCLFIALVYLYFALFFDSHLKKALEFTGTLVHGAEVNIEDIDSSFWRAYFQLSGLQITDKEKPEQNLIQIAKIRLELSWDALLRAKLVVKDATIDDIMAYAPRKKPGRVTPKEETKSGPNASLQKIEDSVLEQSKDQFNENVLGDVANVIGGTDPSSQLEQIQTQLKSDEKIKELEQALSEKEKLWKERINKLPQKPQIDALVAKTKTLKFDTKNPKQFASDIKELDKIIKEGDKIIKDFNEASKSLKSDVSGFNSDIKNLDELIKQDIKDLQTRLKIPSINVADFSKGLFGRMFNEKLGKYKKYMVLAREYMPPKKSSSEKAEDKSAQLVPQRRGEGQNFKFPKQKAYPLFWLQKGHISSREGTSEYSGNVTGEIKDATSQPQLLGKPMTIDIKGEFPKQGLMGIETNIVVDHTTDSPYEKIEASIREYPVGAQKLSDSKDVKLIIAKASGSLKLNGISRDEKIHFLVKNKFSNVKYDIDSSSKIVKDVLTNVTNGLPALLVDAEASGAWSNLRWKIKSNLGDELSNGFKKELQAKLNEAKKKLDDFVNNKIKGKKAQLTQQFAQAKGRIENQVNAKKKDLDKAKQQANNEINNKKSASKGDLKKESKKAEKKLKKLLGF
ncbi:MAG: TIGR03545 family protein [Bdellovibrionales bacterium]|nr:TIGR03545 family protein [Bdellovibrionales bacterium]